MKRARYDQRVASMVTEGEEQKREREGEEEKKGKREREEGINREKKSSGD